MLSPCAVRNAALVITTTTYVDDRLGMLGSRWRAWRLGRYHYGADGSASKWVLSGVVEEDQEP
jgi:hypothetical protein